jgi:hypothetical protein
MLRVKHLPTFDSVAAGRKAVCDLTLGLRYHVIWLVLGNNAVAANAISDLVDDITVKINGKPQRQMTGVQLNDLNGLNGSAFLAKATGTAGQPDRPHYLPIFSVNCAFFACQEFEDLTGKSGWAAAFRQTATVAASCGLDSH